MGMTSKEYHEGYQQGYKDAKADYETRLKADLVAMLTEIQLEIRELWDNDPSYIEGVYDSEMIIQQKIDKLKENNDEIDKSNK